MKAALICLALKVLHGRKYLVDQKFLVKTQNTSNELDSNGKVGSDYQSLTPNKRCEAEQYNSNWAGGKAPIYQPKVSWSSGSSYGSESYKI